LREVLRVHAARSAVGQLQPRVAGGRADVQPVAGGAQHVPEPPPGHALAALQVTERPGAQIGPDRLAAVLLDDGAQPCGDLLQRLVPADALELTGPLGPGPPHRVEDAVGRPGVFQVAVDLHAERAAGVRLVGVAAHRDGLAVAYGHHPGAGVGTVKRARAQNPQVTWHKTQLTGKRPPGPDAPIDVTIRDTRPTSTYGLAWKVQNRCRWPRSENATTRRNPVKGARPLPRAALSRTCTWWSRCCRSGCAARPTCCACS